MENNMYIKIVKNGPYIVSGNIPLTEKIIVPDGKSYKFKDGRILKQNEEYSLCRCGKTKKSPFCDGSHIDEFVVIETASKAKYNERAQVFIGKDIDLMDDQRCGLARFCHRQQGMVWDLLKDTDNREIKQEVIKGACECPTGRLVAKDKLNNQIEPTYNASIDILQDEEKKVSAGIFVKGKIPIKSTDGSTYEIRNRVTLCRCGKSKNKPFCDGTHISVNYIDK